MITVKDLRKWLADLEEDDEVGVDAGGLALSALPAGVTDPTEEVGYLEIGGLPGDDDEVAVPWEDEGKIS